MTINSASSLSAPEPYILAGGNPSLELNFIFDYSRDLTLWVNGAAWNGRDSVPATGAVEFRDAAGSVLFAWLPPTASDATVETIALTTTLKKQGSSLYVSVRLPQAWLAAAQYPIVIDPTLDLSVGASADDDRVRRLTTTAWSILAASLQVGSVQATEYGYGSSARFTGINIPAGATVTVAYEVGVAFFSRSGTTINSDLCAENANNPSQNTSYADHIGRTRTACVPWDAIPAWTAGTSYQSPSIVAPIQAVVDAQAGTGDALKVFWEDKDLESSVGAYRQWASWDDTTYAPPAIHIEYTEGGGTPTPTPTPSPTPRGWNYILKAIIPREAEREWVLTA